MELCVVFQCWVGITSRGVELVPLSDMSHSGLAVAGTLAREVQHITYGRHQSSGHSQWGTYQLQCLQMRAMLAGGDHLLAATVLYPLVWPSHLHNAH
jgi:hypothetical protein